MANPTSLKHYAAKYIDRARELALNLVQKKVWIPKT